MRVALLVLAALASRATADPSTSDGEATTSRRAKLTAAASIGAIHLSYATWSYFAWYRDADTKRFHFERTSWFSPGDYSGGADKVGHFWANYALTRGTTAVLVAGGWSRLPSSLVAAGLTEIAFTLTEIEDGFVYGFDPKDMIANVAGAAFGVLMENVPAIDRLLDFRVQYFPSRDYRRAFREHRSVDIGQDYSGQSFLLALHLGALPGLPDRDWGYWARFVDVAVGFEAHHYSPPPVERIYPRRQTLFAGLSINLQGVLRHLFADSTARRIGIGMFEVYSPPLTTFRYLETSRFR